MAKKVWIINHYAQSPQQAAAAWHHMLAGYLNGRGMATLLIAASTELNTNRQTLEAGEGFRRERHFLRLRAPAYRGNGIGRLYNMLVFAFRLLRLPMHEKPDAIVGSTPQPFAVLSAWLLAKRYRVPFVYEIRDLWPDSLIELGHFTRAHPLAHLLAAIDRFLMKRADLVITVLPGVADYAKRHGAKRAMWIPNGIDMGRVPHAPPAQNDRFTFMFFGSHGAVQGLHVALDAMALLKGENIALRLIGDGMAKEELQAQAVRLGLEHVHFEESVPQAQVPQLAAQADAFLLHMMPTESFRRYGISPNKMYDYMAASRPILFAGDALNDPVRDAGAGITVAPNDPQAMAQAMRSLAALPAAERAAMGDRGRAYAMAHFDLAVLGDQWFAQLAAL